MEVRGCAERWQACGGRDQRRSDLPPLLSRITIDKKGQLASWPFYFAEPLFLQIDVRDVVDFLPKEQGPQAFEFFGGISNEKLQGAAFLRDRFAGTDVLATAKRVLDRQSRGLGGIDQRDMPRHYALQHRLQQRIVCASKEKHVG